MKEYVRLAECSLFAEAGEHTAMMGNNSVDGWLKRF